MQIFQLECFVAVAQTLNFTQAAERLFVAQCTVSYHIARLEKEIGFPLFQRDRQHVALTEAGSRFYATADMVLQQLHTGLSEARDMAQAKKSLSITFMPSMQEHWINACTRGIERSAGMAVHPLYDRNFPKLFQQILRNELTLSFLPSYLFEETPRIGFYSLREGRFFCLMKKSHPLARHVRLEPRDIRDCRLSIPALDCCLPDMRYMHSILDPLCKTQNIHMTNAVLHPKTAYADVVGGGCVAIFSEFMLLRQANLTAIPFSCDYEYSFGFAAKSPAPGVVERILKELQSAPLAEGI